MKIILFGTGDYYSRYKKWFEQQEVVALLDNSESKQHLVIDGVEVFSPEEGIKLNYDVIVILSFYVKQMKQQLVSLGVDKEKIFHFFDVHCLFAGNVIRRPVQYFLKARELAASSTAQKILLMSNDLSLGGPAIALFHAAKVLKKRGYAVVYASMLDGPLKPILIENDISVIVDENLQISTMQETVWVSTFSLLICNTLNFHVFLSERDTNIPVVWWLHDSAFFYEGVNRGVMKQISISNLRAVSVGPVPAEAIRGFLPELKCDELLYGVDDRQNRMILAKEKKLVRFITIGFLEMRKGQDILLQAIKRLPDHIRCRSEFYIVGYGETLFGEQLRSESLEVNEVVYTGSVGREKIHELLDSSDILICPSRQDPMPTVAAEAMMHSVPCILSDTTGTAAYVHDGEDGFVFPCGDVQVLADRIAWCVTNKEQLVRIGKKARNLYEEYFSMMAFEKQIMKIIHEVLEN